MTALRKEYIRYRSMLYASGSPHVIEITRPVRVSASCTVRFGYDENGRFTNVPFTSFRCNVLDIIFGGHQIIFDFRDMSKVKVLNHSIHSLFTKEWVKLRDAYYR